MFSYEEPDYLQEQTIAEIVKNALRIYRRYFWKFFLSYFLLMLPATCLGILAIAVLGDTFSLGTLSYFAIWLVGSSVASLLVTIVVSDICLGDLPSLKRAWRHISARLVSKLLITNLLFYLTFLIFIAGLYFLLIWIDQSGVPSWAYKVYLAFVILLFLALISWFLFVPTIVVLENRWGFRAMKRSVTLGYDYHARNFVIVCMMFGLVTLVPIILFIISLFISSNQSGEWGLLLGTLSYYFIGILIQPLGLIYIVLLYYDIRVRKEGYDISVLPEDLRH